MNDGMVGKCTTHDHDYELLAVVQVYRLTSSVDICRYLAFQLRETNCMRTWNVAVRALIIRYAAVNGYTASICLDMRKTQPLAEFQWLKAVFPDMERPFGGALHFSAHSDKLQVTCKQCGAETKWICSACGEPVRVKCFTMFHNV